MSAEVDVREMRTLCEQIADFFAPNQNEKARTRAVMRQVGVGANRAYEFLKGRARRVDAFEKDAARSVVSEIEEARNAEHLNWLASEAARLREGDADFCGEHIDALEHLVRRLRAQAGPVDFQNAAQRQKED